MLEPIIVTMSFVYIHLKFIYEGCYFDEGVAQYWTEMPLSESPMIYCEIWISNVTETTFDFLIKEFVMATDERTIVMPLSTAKIVNNGWGAIYKEIII